MPKWTKHYTGPYLVVRVILPANAVLQCTKHSVPFVVHCDKLKLCMCSTPASGVAGGNADVVAAPAGIALPDPVEPDGGGLVAPDPAGSVNLVEPVADGDVISFSGPVNTEAEAGIVAAPTETGAALPDPVEPDLCGLVAPDPAGSVNPAPVVSGDGARGDGSDVCNMRPSHPRRKPHHLANYVCHVGGGHPGRHRLA
jgi:hypothetical protein